MAGSVLTIGSSGSLTETAPGTYSAGSVSPGVSNPILAFQGSGNYTLTGLAGAVNDWTISATKGANLDITGLATALSTYHISVDSQSTITFGSGITALSTVNVSFINTGSGTGGTIKFDPALLSMTNPINVTGFATGDAIGFGGAAGNLVAYTPGIGGGMLSLKHTTDLANPTLLNTTVIGSVHIIGTYTAADFAVSSNELDIDFACFLPGTMIKTPGGEIPVEQLHAGDFVTTLKHGTAQIKTVRSRMVESESDVSRPKNRPICIAAGALGENMPRRDLYVSPDYSMYLDGYFVPAQLLLNDVTIVQPPRREMITYYHLELDPHDVIIAEGAATESYLDTGNRSHFMTPGVISLLPETEPKTWEDACAPLLLAGPQLATIRARLMARAMEITGRRDLFLQVA